MRNLFLTILVILNFLLLTGCLSTIQSAMDRSKGDAEFYNKKNYAEAVKAYRSAANNGDTQSSYMLSRILLDKKYGMENVGEGLNRLNAAASSGHVLANRDLGIIYMSGKHGVEKSVTRALPYYEMAAGQDDEVSVLALAMIYGSGMGVQKNPVQAARWFAKAKELGLPIPADMSHPELIASLQPLPDSKTQETSALKENKSLVREAQTLLSKLGYNPGPADGIIGERTRQAVQDFQKKQKIAVTGEISEQLLRNLKHALSTK